MAIGHVGLAITTVGCVLGVLLIIFGGSFYFLEKENKVRIAKAARTLGAGIVLIMVSIPFSIPNHLLAGSAAGETGIVGVIILSGFLGSPLIFMGLASYIGLNSKAQQTLDPITVQGDEHSTLSSREDVLTNEMDPISFTIK